MDIKYFLHWIATYSYVMYHLVLLNYNLAKPKNSEEWFKIDFSNKKNQNTKKHIIHFCPYIVAIRVQN